MTTTKRRLKRSQPRRESSEEWVRKREIKKFMKGVTNEGSRGSPVLGRGGFYSREHKC